MIQEKLAPFKYMIEQIAKENEVDPRLVMAIIWRESAGDPNAVRYEPHYQWTYKPYNKSMNEYCRSLGVDAETETNSQKYSYGLMQVMGGVARELGFNNKYLHTLTDAAYGIKYGCMKLASISKRYRDLHDIIAAYNAGSPKKDNMGKYLNQAYVDFVIAAMGEL